MSAETFRGPDSSPNCANCPCSQNGLPVRPIKGAGALKSLAIVSEGPSPDELSQGWPMVGASGKLLQQALNSAGIDRHSIWITNAILCQRPRDEAKYLEAITCCSPRLRHELGLVNPSGILALGESSASALHLPVTAIKQARGTVQSSPLFPGTLAVTTIHPGAILAGGGAGSKGTTSDAKSKMNVDAQYVFLEADIAKAYSLALNPNQPLWQDDIELIVDTSAESIAKIAFFEQAKPFIAIDLEWDKDDKITWVGLATPEKAISIYLPSLDAFARAWLARIGRLGISKLFHNLQADVPIWEAQIGPLGGTFEDTMLLHHAAFPGAAHDLQNVATQFLLVPPWKADRKNEEKDAAKAAKKAVSASKKEANILSHAEHNQISKEQAAIRKAARIAAHNARNATAKEVAKAIKVSASDILKLLESK